MCLVRSISACSRLQASAFELALATSLDKQGMETEVNNACFLLVLSAFPLVLPRTPAQSRTERRTSYTPSFGRLSAGLVCESDNAISIHCGDIDRRNGAVRVMAAIGCAPNV